MWNWMRKRELKSRDAPTRETTAATPPHGMVPRKYRSLYEYLEHRYADITVLTFAQIEDLLGSALPQLARTQQAWWAIEAGDHDAAHAAAWLQSGRTATANLLAETVTFSRAPHVKRSLP